MLLNVKTVKRTYVSSLMFRNKEKPHDKSNITKRKSTLSIFDILVKHEAIYQETKNLKKTKHFSTILVFFLSYQVF